MLREQNRPIIYSDAYGLTIKGEHGYFEEDQDVPRENDILFVADEAITGFGRLVSWFGTGPKT